MYIIIVNGMITVKQTTDHGQKVVVSNILQILNLQEAKLIIYNRYFGHRILKKISVLL